MATAAWRWSAPLFVVAAISLVGAPEYPALSRAIAKAFAVDVRMAPADPVVVPGRIAAQQSLEAAVLAVPHDVTVSRESSTPPMRGMAPWAFGFAMAGQLADIVTTEIGLARGLNANRIAAANTDGVAGNRGAHLRSHVRLWGYDPRTAQKADAFTDILIEAPQVQDTAGQQGQLSPVSSARQWESEAEANVLERLERASLIAAPGEVEKVLETVINNLEVTNDIVNDPPLKVRVLLTTPLESFTVGRTILLSRGLIDVLPDEASLAMMLAHELAHVVLGHPLIDTQFAFGDRLMVGDDALLRLLKVKRTPAEEAAADAKVMAMLQKSPYKDSLAGSGLFLRIVADRAKLLPNLITPHIGDHIAEGGQIMRLTQVMDAAPELNRERLDQVAALSLGARLTLNPWTARLELIRNAAQLPESQREKVPLAISPLIPYLKYVEAPPLLRP